MLGMRRGPRLVAHGSRLTLTIIADELLATTSFDGGLTWTPPVVVNDVARAAREGLHDLALSPTGELCVVWLDLRSGSTEIWAAASTDGGLTWRKNERVYRSPSGTVCQCCHPSALFANDGTLAVMWRNSVAGSRDLWMTTRKPGADEFSPASKLGKGTWPLAACPMDGGRPAFAADGKFLSVWRRDRSVYASAGDGDEQLVGEGAQPVVASRPGGDWRVVWQQGGSLVSRIFPTAPDGETRLVAERARFAALISLDGGRGELLAHEQGADVVVRRLE